MREIKFRAWDNENGIYLYDVQRAYDMLSGLVKYNDGESADYDEDCFGNFLNNKRRYDVEQFTGMKDQNGKEIYEGDVVKYGSDWGNVGRVVYDAKFGYCIEYKIEYRNQIVRTRQEYFADIQSEVEVVGNIHENADLLEVSE